MVRLLAMGQLPEGWERATFQGELDTGLLLPKLCWEWERCLSSEWFGSCLVVPVVCPRALVGAGRSLASPLTGGRRFSVI